jgi:hypothetical protein
MRLIGVWKFILKWRGAGMRTKKWMGVAALAVVLAGAGILLAQDPSGPVVNIDPHRHGNLATAQEYIVAAYQKIDQAQQANDSHLGGHAANAKNALLQADAELRAAADFANANQPGPPPEPAGPANASGYWTIYANNVDQPGGSTKTVKIEQTGATLSGHFKGPHQSGGIEGFVNGNHIEFSTKTRDVLTFRGEVTGNTMSGMYGVHGQHAPWNAVRSDPN